MSKNKTYQLIQAGSDTATIKIVGSINFWENDSDSFTNKVSDLIEAGVVNVNLYVNSGGGSVLDANEIYNQIKRFTGVKKAEIGAICASAATIIVSACDRVVMAKNGMYMIHEMSMPAGGTVKEMKSYISMVDGLTHNYISMMVDRTGLSFEEIKDMMEKETWMTAAQAKEKGFVDDVIDGVVTTVSDVYNLVSDYSYRNVPTEVMNCAALVKNQETKTESKMKDKLIQACVLAGFNVSATATEEDVLALAGSVLAENNRIKTELKNFKTAAANSLVDAAISARKITAEQKEQFVADATDNYDLVSRVLAAIPTPVLASASIQTQNTPSDTTAWKWDDYVKNGLSKELEVLASANPTKYNQLRIEKFGK